MGKVIRFNAVRQYRQNLHDGIMLEIGRCYKYLGNRVRVCSINASEDGSQAEVTVETQFGEHATVEGEELSRWSDK